MIRRPDLTNHAIVVETDEAQLSVYALPRYQGRNFVGTVIAALSSLTPLLFVQKSWSRFIRRGMHLDDLLEPLAYAVPLLLALTVLLNVILRIRRPRGLKIQLGSVVVDTPDDAISRHTFELSNLDGAKLVHGTGFDVVDLQLARRRGMSITVLRRYKSHEIGHVVDLINDLVNDDRSFAFEVIVRPPTVAAPRSTLPPLPQEPPDRL